MIDMNNLLNFEVKRPIYLIVSQNTQLFRSKTAHLDQSRLQNTTSKIRFQITIASN